MPDVWESRHLASQQSRGAGKRSIWFTCIRCGRKVRGQYNYVVHLSQCTKG